MRNIDFWQWASMDESGDFDGSTRREVIRHLERRGGPLLSMRKLGPGQYEAIFGYEDADRVFTAWVYRESAGRP